MRQSLTDTLDVVLQEPPKTILVVVDVLTAWCGKSMFHLNGI